MTLRSLLPLAVLAAMLAPAAASADWQRGVDYTTYSASTYGTQASDASLSRLASDGNDSVSIVVTQYMSDPFSTVIAPDPRTPTDASLLHAMQTAKALGLHVTLKPQIDVDTGSWRGALNPVSPDAWFTSYEAMIDHYADLAQQGGAGMLVVGTELKSLSGAAYTSRWEQIIAGIKQRFSGALTYAANFDEYWRVGFWGSLDYIGVDAYFPLSSGGGDSVQDLVSAWTSRGYTHTLQAVSQAFGRPVLFTEIGYRSVAGATVHPNIWDSSGAYDMSEQQNAYEAAFEVFAGQPWFAGMYWWSWPAALPPSGWNSDYTPTFKPSEDILRSWNGRLTPKSGTTPGGVFKPAPPATPSNPVQAKKPKAKAKHHAKKKKHRGRKRRHA
jgi:Glycoside Hydrolase Family 113